MCHDGKTQPIVGSDDEVMNFIEAACTLATTEVSNFYIHIVCTMNFIDHIIKRNSQSLITLFI